MHPLLQLLGMAMVMCGFVVLQIYTVLFIVIKKTGGTVKSEAIYAVGAVTVLLFALGAAFVYL